MKRISPLVSEHLSKLVPGDPQLNYCDPAVMVLSHIILNSIMFLSFYRIGLHLVVKI